MPEGSQETKMGRRRRRLGRDAIPLLSTKTLGAAFVSSLAAGLAGGAAGAAPAEAGWHHYCGHSVGPGVPCHHYSTLWGINAAASNAYQYVCVNGSYSGHNTGLHCHGSGTAVSYDPYGSCGFGGVSARRATYDHGIHRISASFYQSAICV
jgi:hypothetical protein